MKYRGFNFLRVQPPLAILADFDGRILVLHRGPGGIGFVFSFEFNHKVDHISNIVTDEFGTELVDEDGEVLDGGECGRVLWAENKDAHIE